MPINENGESHHCPASPITSSMQRRPTSRDVMLSVTMCFAWFACLLAAVTPIAARGAQTDSSAAAADVLQLEAKALIGKSNYLAALAKLQSALVIDEKSRPTESLHDLNNIGILLQLLGRYMEAIENEARAITVATSQSNYKAEAEAYTVTGEAQDSLGHYDDSIASHKAALRLYRTLGDTHGEGVSLNDIGVEFNAKSDYADALQQFVDALRLFRSAKDRKNEGAALGNIGSTYDLLGQPITALDYYQQERDARRQDDDPSAEARALNNIGNLYDGFGNYLTALDNYQQALGIFNGRKDPLGTADTLCNLGAADLHLSRLDEAQANFNQALSLYRQLGDRRGEAQTLNNIGILCGQTRHFAEQEVNDTEALIVFREIGDRADESTVLANLMDAAFSQGNRDLAIYYGKLSVNGNQLIRRSLSRLSASVRRSFAAMTTDRYRELAQILILTGRLPEAQQVLNLLKEQEFFDFVRRDPSAASGMGEADFNRLEREADGRIQALGDAVTALATSYDALAAKSERTADDEKRLDILRPQIQAARNSFQKTLADLVAIFAAHAGTVAQQDVDIKDSPALVRTLNTLQKDTQQKPVAVYTLVGEKTLRFLIYTTNGVPVAREYPIGAADLRRKVYAFRDALCNPRVDPRPLGKQLYDILIGPVEKDLDGTQATEVMWSLDDALRYTPLAALSPDGEHYLIESLNRRHSIFTPATLAASALTGTPNRDWSALALGVSKPHVVKTVAGEDNFDALPGVPVEISGIVKATDATSGVMGGTVLLDEKFTRITLEKALEQGRGKFLVVHIASHFNFRPGGDDGSSYLLLGDGNPLSLADIKGLSTNLFTDVDLLTLSACDTATGGNGASSDPGAEVESFGALAQREGAAAVLASLWPVSDASTPVLMRQFYLLRQARPDLPKAEALRQAQVALLMGRVGTPATQIAAKRSDLLATPPKAASNDAPVFTPDPAKPWAHPYYWAPFILIGNWK